MHVLKANRLDYRQPSDHALRRQGGFTLLEIMVVVVIIGILATFILQKVAGRPYEAQRTKVFSDFSVLSQSLEMYQLDNFDIPTVDEGLNALISAPRPDMRKYPKGGYISKAPKDPWGRDYIYVRPGQHGTDFDLISYGRDGQVGGEGADADLGSWMDPN